MKKVIAIIIAVGIFTAAMFAYQVMAGGGKVMNQERGEKASGDSVQNCNNFEEGCPYGDESPNR